MNTIDRKLQALYLFTLIAGVGVFVYFEFLSGMNLEFKASQPDSMKYGAEIVTDLLTIAMVYLSTRLMRMPKVMKSIASDSTLYVYWAYLRWAMLALVIFLGLAVRYVLFSPSTLGCPIVGTLAMFFVWPTAVRREGEIQTANEKS